MTNRDAAKLHVRCIARGSRRPDRHIAGLWRAIRPALRDLATDVWLIGWYAVQLALVVCAALAVVFMLWIFGGAR